MVTPIYDTTISARDNSYRSYPESSSDSERDSPRRPRAVYTDSEDGDYQYSPRDRRNSSYERSHRRSPPRHEYPRDYDDHEGRPRYPPSDVYSPQEPLRTSSINSDYGYPSSSNHERVRSGDHAPRDLHRLRESLVGEMHEEMQKYFKVLPPAPNFFWSKCNGRKKAVCVSRLIS